jgi:hypothetical protein
MRQHRSPRGRAGKGPDIPIREVTSIDVKYCFADDEIESARWPRDLTKQVSDLRVPRSSAKSGRP